MKLEKAIEIKGRTGEEFLKTDAAEVDEADRLSIEAMKEVLVNRRVIYHASTILLPGETEE